MMILREEDLKVLEEVPAGKWHEVMDFARFLAGRSENDLNTEKKSYRHGEWVKGEIWISDDFNDPVEFVSPEEMRVLETMRKNKKDDLQEAVV